MGYHSALSETKTCMVGPVSSSVSSEAMTTPMGMEGSEKKVAMLDPQTRQKERNSPGLCS